MRIFLDSSVALAATFSATGASREIFNHATSQGWELVVSPWVVREVRENLAAKAPSLFATWSTLSHGLCTEDDELSFDWPILFEASKDKPVLFSALACADVLLTLDRRDFCDLIGKVTYGLRVLTPGAFLEEERAAGRIA